MTPADARSAATALMAALVQESGARWGEVAVEHQRSDAAAVLDTTGPRRHWLGRSRGYSKTSDVAGLALAALLTQIPAGSIGYCAAGDADQAGLLLRAIRGYVSRTPELVGAVTVQQRRVIATRSGNMLEVISSDASSAYGLLPACC